MRIPIVLSVIVVFLAVDVLGRKKKEWLKHPSIVVLKKNTGEVKELPTEDFAEKKSHHRRHHHHKHHRHHDASQPTTHQRILSFGKTDALPYSSPFSRPYQFNMYTDGPFGWGSARRRRFVNSYNIFKRGQVPRPWPQNYGQQPRPYQPAAQPAAYYQPAQPAAYYQPARPASYVQPAPQPYNYQAAASRNTLTQASPTYPRQPLAQPLRRKAPQVQKPQERTWVDKLGVTWTTRKVNDYKWGEREPGVTMDEYAGGPFGFDDVKRSQIQRAPINQWERRSSIPKANRNIRPRSWVDKFGVRWTNQKVNDYKWGERMPGVTMDEYNGGPFGWSDVKRNKIYYPNRPRK